MRRRRADVRRPDVGPAGTVRRQGPRPRRRRRRVRAGDPRPGSRRDPGGGAGILRCPGPGGAMIIKAVAGGGGRGTRAVDRGGRRWKPPTSAASPKPGRRSAAPMSMSRSLLPRARHVEVQILGDRTGNIAHLGERECSIQRRFQKFVEVAPAPGLAADLRERSSTRRCASPAASATAISEHSSSWSTCPAGRARSPSCSSRRMQGCRSSTR